MRLLQVLFVLALVILGQMLLSKFSFSSELVNNLLPWIELAESSGNPLAVSKDKKSWGLHQITQPVLDDYNLAHRNTFTLRDLLDPNTSEKVAYWYLNHLNKWLSKKGFPNDTVRLLVAWNWGRGNLSRNNFCIPEWFYSHPNRVYRNIAKIGEVPVNINEY